MVTFNTAIASFPANLISGMFGFKEQSLYEVEESKKADLDIKEILQK